MRQHIRIHKAEANTGALDMRHLLDAPAGKHGYVKVKDGHLVFEDNTRARFIGFNLPTRSNTPDHETAEKLAERFASLGVNVIRLHAADAPIGDEPASWSSCREAPLIDYENGDTRHFNAAGLERFEYFVAKLKENGIYLHIDLIVARQFMPGDGVPEGLPGCLKCYTMIDDHLINLQKEYAQALLTHINPYTGMSLIDDPAVMTIQINNEDSVLKESVAEGAAKVYREELMQKFGRFLAQKYGNREKLAEAWTHEGMCALGDDEDPFEGTVCIIEGSFVQPVNDPLGDWNSDASPARYADYMEFGIERNRGFYQDFKNFLISLGAKVPIATSNLLGGAADVYGHIDADVMENNSYFNHPILPTPGPNQYIVAGPTEFVSVNPLTMQRGIGSLATTLLSLGSEAVVEGKPFVLSEWNEYGLHPFHSTAFLSTVAYACLNDWDGLIMYCHHTSQNWDDQPADAILNVFDFYNDPAVIGIWNFLASVFLKGLVAAAPHRVDVVYTQDDLLTLPNGHAMNHTFLPYITKLRNVFLDDNRYSGNADAAVNAGFVNNCDLENAKHGVYYAWSAYRDAFRKHPDDGRLAVHRSMKDLVIPDISSVAGDFDYREYAAKLDAAMKEWNIWPEDTGLVDGKLVAETGEIITDAANSGFSVSAPGCACFSGKPDGTIELGNILFADVKNKRITLTLLPEDADTIKEAHSFIINALGESGMDETTVSPVELWPGVPFGMVNMQGKLYADTLEGTITVRARNAVLVALDTTGHELSRIQGTACEDGVRFRLDGMTPAINFRLSLSDVVKEGNI